MRKLFPAVALAFSIVLSSCEGGIAVPIEAQKDFSGTYTLETVNAAGLPWVIRQNSVGRQEVYGGAVTLRPDRSFTETLQFRAVFSGGSTTNYEGVQSGTYSLAGSVITFTVLLENGAPAHSYKGTITERDLTYSATAENMAVKYRRL